MKRQNGVCYIVAAGKESRLDFVPAEVDLVIAADGGYDYLKKADIRTDLLIGDMDSVKGQTEGVKRVKLSREKNDTDTLAAIRLGLARGYKIFHLYCGMGRRFSHSFANVQCLEFLAKRGCRGSMFYDGGVMTVIHNGELVLSGRGYISVFSLSSKTTVDIQGLKYNVKNMVFTSDFPIGVSNEFVRGEAKITAKKGSVLVVYNEDL